MAIGTTALLVGGALAGAAGSYFGAKKAADAQKAATAQQQKQYEQTRADLAPYREAGTGALGTYETALGLRGAGPQGDYWGGMVYDPQFVSATNLGLQGVQRSAAARGGLFGGRTLKELQDYGQNAYYGYGQNRLNQLAGLTTMGQNAAAQTGTLGAQYADMIGKGTANAGALMGAGYAGIGNALAGAAGNYNTANMFQNYLKGASGSSYTG